MKKHFTSSAIIVEQNKILLIFHKKLGVWLYPGGHIEEDEHPDEALLREVKEETGLDVEIIENKDDSLSNIGEDVTSLNIPYAVLCERVNGHYHNDLIYLCKLKNKSDFNKFESKEEIGFFSLEETGKLKLFDNFRILINKVLN
ncbi:DNA mismatch repair protein MutT [Candidatus Parcubacteria bacterium]|nr:MAG: DNA mismatch repair protein MutT [Candidatus Parcubacteria bacterium]